MQGVVTKNSIGVSWSAENGGGTNTYDVTISPNDGGGAGQKTGTSDTSTNFTGLNASTNYTVTVRVENGSGNKTATRTIATSDLVAPGSPTGVSTIRDGRNVTVGWVRPADTGDGLVEYIVTFTRNGGTPASITQTVPAAATTADFLDVPSGNYTVSVVAPALAATARQRSRRSTSRVCRVPRPG